MGGGGEGAFSSAPGTGESPAPGYSRVDGGRPINEDAAYMDLSLYSSFHFSRPRTATVARAITNLTNIFVTICICTQSVPPKQRAHQSSFDRQNEEVRRWGCHA